MFRAAPRLIARSTALQRSAANRSIAPARRYISTAPPTQKSRSWKSLVARFGIAGTIIYYYNTTDVFAEEPHHPIQALPETEVESEHLPTIESITAEREKRKAVQAQLDQQAQKEALSTQRNAQPTSGGEGGMEGLEDEAGQQGAFNPETGEINWDCPCLGGMADGPCGPEFKAAFSCFVYSTEEPKGMDCIDRFKDMQNCFRKYPEVYGSELDSDADDEDDLTADAAHPAPAQSESLPTATYSDSTPAPSSKPASKPASSKPAPESKSSTPSSEAAAADKGKQSGERTSKPSSSEDRPGLGLVPDNYKPDAKSKSQEPTSESEDLVPKGSHDSGDANTDVLERK